MDSNESQEPTKPKKRTTKPRTTKAKSTAPIDPVQPDAGIPTSANSPNLVQSSGQWNGELNTEVCSTQEADSPKFVPVSQVQTEEPIDSDADSSQPPILDDQDGQKNTGDVADPVLSADSNYGAKSLESLPFARARDGETNKQCWERLRREGRAAGMTRRGAIAYAGVEVDRLFPPAPPPAPVIVEELPDDSELKPAEPTSDVLPAEVVSQKTVEETARVVPAADLGVSGLGDIPESWPSLPANAQLQVEIAWVSANRLRVRSGSGVDLSRALSPAPSYSALSWLETSILFPAKFADISVKATVDQDDEREFIKREKLAIEEIRSILKEMLEAKS